ncbi:MAG TPA: hypothetical protein VK395_32415 [Gemmataceae bacterium]|nr:hypothetical protein [Gemmataceae bacterium]
MSVLPPLGRRARQPSDSGEPAAGVDLDSPFAAALAPQPKSETWRRSQDVRVKRFDGNDESEDMKHLRKRSTA